MEYLVISKKDWCFQTDGELKTAIEKLFGTVESHSKCAYEEYISLKGFGLAQKQEGLPIQSVNKLEQGFAFRCSAPTYAIYCTELENQPIVRAVLFGAIMTKVNGYPKETLYMYWRQEPESSYNRDFDSSDEKYKIGFRIGMYHKPRIDSLEGAIDLAIS